MLVGYTRVSAANDRQSVDLQRVALAAAGVDDRHLHQGKESGARDDRSSLKACLGSLRSEDCLVFLKPDRPGPSSAHLLSIISDLKGRGVASRALIEQTDTTTPHGELLFSAFSALEQYERALACERVVAGLIGARKRGRRAGRCLTLDQEKIAQSLPALKAGVSKAPISRTFNVPRSILIDMRARIGWNGAPGRKKDNVAGRARA